MAAETHCVVGSGSTARAIRMIVVIGSVSICFMMRIFFCPVLYRYSIPFKVTDTSYVLCDQLL